MGPCRRDQVRNQLGTDGHPRPVLAVLAGVAVVGNHHSDPRCRGALQCIHHDQQLHQVLIHGVAGRLHHEDVDSAHVLQKLEVNLAVGEALQLGLAHFHSHVLCDFPRQFRIR